MNGIARIRSSGDNFYAEADGDMWRTYSAAPWLGGTLTSDRRKADGFLSPAEPTKIVCVGRNYAAHAAELGNDVPSFPLLFLKPPSSLIGHEDAIELPDDSERIEHEGELALIIGTRLKNVTTEGARAGVFGFTTANDVTARDLQRADVQFTRAKSFDSFCPLGPTIRRDLDVSSLPLRVHCNDELRQDGNTALMVCSTFELVSIISNVMTLEPGDVVLTGTPAGVGPIVDGDRVRVEIEGLDALENPVRRTRSR